ncbi:porin [Rodentibacter caecimuris]|uniref:Transporter n=1 Tax=Rodentibacter caecimuris TaxID=1796644 RepID=A0ABX3KWL5_9PAST|nr:hypothetical protein BKG89_07485 [Rodentibacter heylii]
MKKFNQSLLASAMFVTASGAHAAAFQLSEVSTVGLGRAYAGEAAMADNASVVATNPALMNQFKTYQFSVGGIYVDSKIRMEGPVTAKVLGVTVAEGSAYRNSVVPGSLVPNMYFVAPINDKFAIGGGMNVNFGLKSEYDSNYDAGIFGGKTELSAINLNLSGSYRITQGLSAGVGVNAVYAKAEVQRTAGILDTAIDNVAKSPALQQQIAQRAQAAGLNPSVLLPSLGALGAQIDKETVLTHLQDKAAWGFGWNLGLAYDFNARNRIGIAYHSKIDIDFKDRNAVSYLPYGTQAYVGEGSLTLHLPDYLEVSGFHQLTDKFAMHYSYKYTRWSRLKNLHATYMDKGLRNEGLAFHKDEEYNDTSRIALGATYDVNDKLTVRAGIAYDESAAPRTHVSASIPDTDRTWYSVGATYKFTPDLSVDLAFAHLRGKKLQFKETQSLADGLATIQTNYSSRATANLYGLNLNYSF